MRYRRVRAGVLGLFALGVVGCAPATSGAAYATWHARGRSVGGMAELTARWGAAAPHWTVHFQVTELDAAAERARTLGGTVLHGPVDAPGLGRLSLLQDPQGAAFALLEPAGPPA